MMVHAVTTLNQELLKVSLMGEWHRPMQHLLMLASVPPIARTMTQLPKWAPAVRIGREVHTTTVLGAAFGVTSLPGEDLRGEAQPIPFPQPQPNVATSLFSNSDTRQAEVRLLTRTVMVYCYLSLPQMWGFRGLHAGQSRFHSHPKLKTAQAACAFSHHLWT